VLVVAGAAFMSSLLQEGTAANTVLALVGGSVSGGFLLLIGCFNAAAARRAWTLRARAHAGAALEPHQLEAQGLLTRLLARPLSRLVTPRGMYVLGFLFGLGFDTASTMSLLILTASASLSGVSAWTLASLPFFFAAGMCLCDSLNGFAVLRLYRTAWQDPARKLGFNAAVTGASAVSALFIAAITIGGVAHRGLGLHDPLTTWLAGVDLGEAGLALVALMLAFWGVAALLERARRRPEPTVREP
jgi:high-affinity nickel-transport protein